MELALLCDLKIFMFIYDPKQNRVIHFASDPELDLQDIFNFENQREFYSNLDVSSANSLLIICFSMRRSEDAISMKMRRMKTKAPATRGPKMRVKPNKKSQERNLLSRKTGKGV
jgi:hypothetical protein